MAYYHLILFPFLIIATAREQSSGACVSSNIPADSCLTSTTWTLDDDSTKQLIQSVESSSGNEISSLDVTGSSTLSFTSNTAKWVYDNLIVALDIEVEGTEFDTKTTINGHLNTNWYMTGSKSFCMHVTDGQGQADIEVSGVDDITEDLTPEGGFIDDNYVFEYTCTAKKLSLQGTLNGKTVVGPYDYVGNGSSEAGPMICNSKRSDPSTCVAFDWAPLVKRACSDYVQAKQTAPNTRGYFGQVLNIVCASSKSTDSCCNDMAKYYDKPGCDEDWAGSFEQSVFNTFLGPGSPDFNQVMETAFSDAGRVLHGIPMRGILGEDWGTLFAGGDHFINQLAGPFNDYIQKLVAKYDPVCDLVGLNSAIKALTAEHESLFRCAVLPGFDTQFLRGDIGFLATIIAQNIVPFTARNMRQFLILSAEINSFNFKACLAKSPTKRDIIARAVTPSDLQNLAKFNNLTIPSNPAFQNDYRTWVEKTQPSLSTITLPGAYYQILPHKSNVVADLHLNDSTAGVKITADRSSFKSEAVIAVSLSPVNSTNSSATPHYSNTSFAIFGDVVSIVPATSPIGDNGYLFSNLTNSSISQSLNESSVLDDGYNVLFDTFDIDLSYAQPAPVPVANLVIVDLTSGAALPSTGTKIPGVLSARGIEGHRSTWGGGGVYAVGYKVASNSNI